MKKTISRRTLNKIIVVVYALMMIFRIGFFFLLAFGIVHLIRGHYQIAAFALMVSSIVGGVLEPAMAGGMKAAMKNIAAQEARIKANG